MTIVSAYAPAKLNLFLHITGRRDDGYHDIQSVFSAIDLADELIFGDTVGEATELVTLHGADGLTTDIGDNLITRAVMLLAHHYPKKAYPINIELIKNIPTGAGLGGGSSDAATTLMALNQLWDLRLDMDALINYGVQLGADVPFFIFAHHHASAAIAAGIGDRLIAIHRPTCHYLLLMPDVHIPTGALFGHAGLNRAGESFDHAVLAQADFNHGKFTNAFEPLVASSTPKVAHALAYLRTLESRTNSRARMTGTGAAVFLPVTSDVMINLSDAEKKMMVDASPCRTLWVKDIYGG